MKKKILISMLFLVLACTCLGGCGGSNKKAYEAYKEFYREFYDEHFDAMYSEFDCGGQILFNEDNEPLLAICDLTVVSEKGIADVYVYEYKRGKVKELARKTGLTPSDDAMYIDSIDGKITLFVFEDEGPEEIPIIYSLGKDGFEKEKMIVDYGEIYLAAESNTYVDFWVKVWPELETNSLYNAFYAEFEEPLTTICGSNFEMLLNQLAESKPKTQLDLKMAYTQFFNDEDIYEDTTFSYVDDEKIYTYSSAENKFYYAGKLGVPVAEDTLKDMDKKINGIEVELASSFIVEVLDNLYIEDIEKIEHKDNILTIQTTKGVSLDILTTYNSEDNNLTAYWNVHIGKNVPRIEEETESADADYSNAAIESPDSAEEIDITKESTAESVIKYFDAGIATDIRFEAEKVSSSKAALYGVTVTIPDIDSYLSVMDEEEKQQYIVENEVIPAYEKYVSDNFGNGEYNVYNLIYIDDDNIPELLFDNSCDGRGTEVLSYRNGEIFSSSAWCRGYSFNYVPKENKMVFEGTWLEDVSGSVAHLENGVLVEEHSYYFDFDDEVGEGGIYQIDGAECSEAEYNNFIETYFKVEGTEFGWKTYSSIAEAYDNLGKITFKKDGGFITKFEMTDNILTVETEDGQSISYPVADDCKWESTSYGEVYGTYTFESLKEVVESERNRYLADPEMYDSPAVLIVDIKDEVIVRIYTNIP